MSALLRLRDDVWAVVEMACAEIDDPDCLDAAEFFPRLRERFRGAPTEIFE